MFCVECGKSGETHDGLCMDCLLKKRVFVSMPEILDVQVCPECGAVRVGKKWHDALDVEAATLKTLAEKIKKDKDVKDVKLTLELSQRDARNYIADVRVEFSIGEITTFRESRISVRLKKDSCQRCGKRAGHYYEAVIQLRGPQERSREDRMRSARDFVVGRIENLTSHDRDIFISKEEKMHGGFDFYVSSGSAAKSIARDLAKEYGAEAKTSSSMAGRKDGQDMVRMTYLVRIPEYEIGDIISMKGRFYLLCKIESGSLHLKDLETWQESGVSLGRMDDIEVIPQDDCVTDTDIVSESEKEIQILDPDTMKTIELRKPPRFEGKGPSVFIAKTRKGIFLVPPCR